MTYQMNRWPNVIRPPDNVSQTIMGSGISDNFQLDWENVDQSMLGVQE